MSKRLESIGEVNPFNFFPVEKLQQYVHLGTLKHYDKGSAVVLPGDVCLSIIYVCSGKLRVNEMFDDGRERLICYIDKNRMYGRIYKTEKKLYVLAIEDTEVCFFSKEQILKVFNLDESIIFDIIMNYFTKVSFYMKQSTELVNYNPTIRVIRLLYRLAITQGKINDSSNISFRLSQKTISQITGAHFVTVSKVMTFLKRENIIKKTKNNIVILDLEKLKKLTKEHSLSMY